MKLDYELNKKILLWIQDNTDGIKMVWVTPQNLEGNYTQDQINYHMHLMSDDFLIEGKFHRGAICVSRLTAEGHRVLEAISNDKLWQKIQGFMKDAGIGALKEIPGIAVKLALSGSV